MVGHFLFFLHIWLFQFDNRRAVGVFDFDNGTTSGLLAWPVARVGRHRRLGHASCRLVGLERFEMEIQLWTGPEMDNESWVFRNLLFSDYPSCRPPTTMLARATVDDICLYVQHF